MSSVSGWWAEARRQRGHLPHARLVLADGRLDRAKDLYKRDLLCHYGCVNAIEFSQDGRLLVSGGDDRRVIIWQFGQTIMDHGAPEQMVTQHFSNIFCLAITPDNSRIFSGGNDDQVIVHDTKTKRIVEVLPHQKAVCGVAIDPFNPRVLSTAGNDGRLLVFDTRQSIEESLVVSRSRKAFHAVAFHPVQCNIIVAANARDGAALWDLRKPKHAFIKYGNEGSMSQNCMSVRFDKTGDHILALRRRLPPVLYAVDAVEPVAKFYHPDYYNSCTMKSCSFAGDRDQFVLSGSDDFNLYMWKIPDSIEQTWVDQTQLILYGHRSIVNQVRYNPHYCVIASSGVEKIIKLWSPLPIKGSKGSITEELLGPDNPRDVYSHEDYVSLVHHSGQYISHNYTDQSTSEDPRMMAFFDSLVQREIEGWSADDTDSLSNDDNIASGVTSNINSNMRSRRAPPPTRFVIPPPHKDSDSSDSDQMLRNFLKKKYNLKGDSNNFHILVPNGIRNQRCQNRINRLIATRQPKLFRIAQKRLSTRCNKIQMSSLSSNIGCSNKRSRAPRPLRARRGLRRGGPSPPLHMPSVLINNAIESPLTDSEVDSDTSPSHTLGRHTGKVTRPNRRRIHTPRHSKRKSKTLNYHAKDVSSHSEDGGFSNVINGNHLNDINSTEDQLAVPSTSTGIRGHHIATLFRIAEADSDDDQSAGSCSKSPSQRRLSTENQELPLVSILPTPINGSRENVNDTLHINIPWENNQSDRILNYDHLLDNGYRNTSDSIQIDLQNWDRSRNNDMRINYTPTLARLRNETNESEVESSCSTRSTADDVYTPNKQHPSTNLLTPDSGIQTGPCTSSGSRGLSQTKTNGRDQEGSDEPDWVIAKHRQRIKRTRRNYRTHIGDSDST